MRVRYIGPVCDGDGVTVAATGQTCVRGSTIEVSDDLGLSLCDQHSNWAPDGVESVELFAGFCRWVAAVREAEADAAPAPVALVDGAPLPNPGLDALTAPAPAPKRRTSTTDTAEEG